jgi:hypothetical protein
VNCGQGERLGEAGAGSFQDGSRGGSDGSRGGSDGSRGGSGGSRGGSDGKICNFSCPPLLYLNISRKKFTS